MVCITISFKFWFLAMCWITFLPIVRLQNSSSNKPEVCDAWKNSEDANFSYFVLIQEEKGYYFCSGKLLQSNWVLTSYSCFLRIVNYSKDVSNFLGNDPPEIQIFNDENDNKKCFQIRDLQDTKIRIKTTLDNCVDGITDIDRGIQTLPLFGVINDNYEIQQIQFFNQSNNNNNNDSNKTVVHVNDFLLLKLRDSFPDVPVNRVNLAPFEFDSNNDYEILLQVQNRWNFYLEMGRTEVFSGVQNENFRCSQNFSDSVCSKNEQICEKQTYICGEFEIPQISGKIFQIHSGDPLIQKQDSPDAKIFGFLSLDFLPPNYREIFGDISEFYYGHKPGNYYFDKNGAVFVGFTSEILDWVDETLKLYSGDDCAIEKKPKRSLVLLIVIPIIVGIVIFNIVKKLKVASVFILVKKNMWMNSNAQGEPETGRNEDVSRDELEGMRRYGTIGENRCHRVYRDGRLPTEVPKIDILEKLREIQCLGNGAFGEVWSAQWQENQGQHLEGQKVAVKILMFQETVRTFEDFRQEIELMNHLNQFNSPYIPRFFGADNSIKGPAIVMELMEGGCLYKLLNSDDYNFNLEWQLTLFLNIANGLQFLHQNNIVHQDLKPANILLQGLHSSSAKICDFGFARTNPIRSSSIRGTPKYMAPEQQNRDRRNVTQKCDIYAFGVIMEEVVMGTQRGQEDAPTNPTNSSVINFLGNVFNFNRDRQVQLPPGYPNDLEQLIQSCQRNNQDNRPNADQVVVQLENMLQNVLEQV